MVPRGVSRRVARKIILSDVKSGADDLHHQHKKDDDSNKPDTDLQFSILEEENRILRQTIRQLELENEYLKKTDGTRIIIENFEGGRKRAADGMWFESGNIEPLPPPTQGITLAGEQMVQDDQMWCDELDGEGTCPIEPTISFTEALRDRAYWLVGLLALQSCSGFILARNELLLARHPVIVYFLTML